MEHGLRRGELRDWRQDSTSIAGEEDDIRGMVGREAGHLDILDVLDWIGTEQVRAAVVAAEYGMDGTNHRVFSVKVESS